MRILWDEDAWEEYMYWQKKDKKVLHKINELIKDTMRNGYGGMGKPEPLRFQLSGYWSKRITDKDRLIFKIEEYTIKIISCQGHYN